jgi:hypothetical protein
LWRKLNALDRHSLVPSKDLLTQEKDDHDDAR